MTLKRRRIRIPHPPARNFQAYFEALVLMSGEEEISVLIVTIFTYLQNGKSF